MSEINLKLKTYDQLTMEIVKLQIDILCKDKEIERLNNELQDFKVQDISNQEKLYNLIEENERLNNIINEAINYIDDNIYYKDHKGHININDLLDILKGEDKE